MFDFLSCPFCSGLSLGEDNNEGKMRNQGFQRIKMSAQIKSLQADFWVNFQLIGEKKNEWNSHIPSCVKILTTVAKLLGSSCASAY